MSKKLQLRGGTTSEHSSFTGAVREVTVDTDKDTLVVHDGSTAGGIPLAKASEIVATTLTSLSVTSTAAELNILDGVTSTTAELNVVDMSASSSTSGQLLTSTGTGSVPTWQDAPQGVSNSKLFYYGSFS